MFTFTFIWKFVFELIHADRQVSGLMEGKHNIKYSSKKGVTVSVVSCCV